MNVTNAELFDVDIRVDADGVLYFAPDVIDRIRSYKNTEFSVVGIKFDRVDYENDALSFGDARIDNIIGATKDIDIPQTVTPC